MNWLSASSLSFLRSVDFFLIILSTILPAALPLFLPRAFTTFPPVIALPIASPVLAPGSCSHSCFSFSIATPDLLVRSLVTSSAFLVAFLPRRPILSSIDSFPRAHPVILPSESSLNVIVLVLLFFLLLIQC